MSDEEVRARLRVLAEHDRGLQAPPRIEAALLAAFRERAGRPRRRITPWFWACPGLAAAAAAVVIAVMPTARPALPPLPRPQPPSARGGQAPWPAPDPLVRPLRAHAAGRPGGRPQTRASAPRQVREVATEFYPLQYGPPEAVTTIVRTSVPRTTLALFGLPVNPDRLSESVLADVAFSNGGTARAIRFVREVPVYSQISMRRGEVR